MNYIQHLSTFYTKLYTDNRFTPHHISLYLAIFQTWNTEHFHNPIQVSRHELMKLAKIGSINTYIRCLKELEQWNYIQYFPSRNITVGSRIAVLTFDNTTDNRPETPLRHLNKQIETEINIPLLEEVEEYFRLENFPIEQASLFYNYNQSKAWMIGSSPIKNWQAAAINWISKQRSFKRQSPKTETAKTDSKPINHLENTEKNYNEPL